MKTPHRHAHRFIWILLAFAIPGMLVMAFVLQQTRFEKRPAVQIEPPRGELRP